MTTIRIIGLIGILFCLYMIYRDTAVLFFLLKNIDRDEEYPSLYEMVLKFWIWPLEKFNKAQQAGGK